LTIKPTEIIAEVAGRSAGEVFPVPSRPPCPFSGQVCSKTAKGESLPVCSVFIRNKPVAVCPKRLLQADILADVVATCWRGAPPPPSACEIVSEVKMEGFGNVDFVVVAKDINGEIKDFVSVEVQAIDTTGSYNPAFQALKSASTLPKKPVYNLNYDNVYKRYVTQLIRKGYFHHHWGTRIIGVMQDIVFEDIQSRFQFLTTPNLSDPAVNIVFLVYEMIQDTHSSEYRLSRKAVIGTSHANLQQAVMYAGPPDKQEFIARINKARNRRE
jgi:hypothetical protein